MAMLREHLSQDDVDWEELIQLSTRTGGVRADFGMDYFFMGNAVAKLPLVTVCVVVASVRTKSRASFRYAVPAEAWTCHERRSRLGTSVVSYSSIR